MIDIIIIQINGLILVAKPIKNETTELVLPIISERGVRYSICAKLAYTNCGGPAWI